MMHIRNLLTSARRLLRSNSMRGILLSTALVQQPLETFSLIKNDSLGSQMRTASLSSLGEASKLLDLHLTAVESLMKDYASLIQSLCFIYESELILHEDQTEASRLSAKLSELKREILDLLQLKEYVQESLENATRASFLLGNRASSEMSWEKIGAFAKKIEEFTEDLSALDMELTRAKVKHIGMVAEINDAQADVETDGS